MVNSLEIRAKKLGVLIRDARTRFSKESTDCAQAMGVSVEKFVAFENGEQAPSLPELEALSYFLDIPVEHFLGRKSINTNQTEQSKLHQLENLLPLRNRIIGVMLRKARIEAGISFEELGKHVEVKPEQIKAFETGTFAVPLPELEMICLALNLSMREFQDQQGPIGKWALQKKSVDGFLELPPDMQQFISKPINLPYLELAQRLSEMSVDRLRSVAEGLLEITL
ncbi:MAG TPA: hypothetical protein DEH25_03620 [Chloroflexi bacterium]|nr:hypothetical protein [Chloroflexota bacterium]HBY09254.1 hypothetical protein [Chloroflexota bacterium]